jgi:CRP-like cAMP-binding protein
MPSEKGVSTPQRNLLLAGLSSEASFLLYRHMKEREFAKRTVLWEADAPTGRIFFPVSGLISIRMPTGDGKAIEVAIIGREGAAGIQEGLGPLPMPTRAVIQVRGRFVVISTEAFAACMDQSEEIRRASDLCKAWRLLQSQQIGACNSAHQIGARFCRWLLRASDALEEDIVPVTQGTIAQMLGVRRTTITLIAKRFESKGAISYTRGKIAIRDRAALEAGACDCHRVLGRMHWPSELIQSCRGPM